MSVASIGGGGTPFIPPSISSAGASGASGASSSSGGTQAAAKSGESPFAKALNSVDQLSGAADQAALGVATGTLQDVHQFTVAAAKANIAVQLTAATRNRAVEAYQDIMRMQV